MFNYLIIIFLFFSACNKDLDFSAITVDRCFQYFQDVYSFQDKEIQELEKYIEAIEEHIRAEKEALSYKKDALESLKSLKSEGEEKFNLYYTQFNQHMEKAKKAINDMNQYWNRALSAYQDAARAHEDYVKSNEVVTVEKCSGALKKKSYPEEAVQALDTIEEFNNEVKYAREEASEAGDEGTKATEKEYKALTNYRIAFQTGNMENAILAFTDYIEAFEGGHIPADKKLLSSNEDLIDAKKEKQTHLKEFLDIIEGHRP